MIKRFFIPVAGFLLTLVTIISPAQTIVVDPALSGQKTSYATRKLTETLQQMGKKPIIGSRVDTKAEVRVTKQADVAPGGFALANQNGKISIAASDGQGALYGLLDLAQQLRFSGGLAGCRPGRSSPG